MRFVTEVQRTASLRCLPEAPSPLTTRVLLASWVSDLNFLRLLSWSPGDIWVVMVSTWGSNKPVTYSWENCAPYKWNDKLILWWSTIFCHFCFNRGSNVLDRSIVLMWLKGEIWGSVSWQAFLGEACAIKIFLIVTVNLWYLWLSLVGFQGTNEQF